MIKQNIFIETERLIIRPFEAEDYQNWLTQYHNELPSQYKYDEGKRDASNYTMEWFENWVKHLNALADEDKMYNFGIFRKVDGANIGKVEVWTILRMDYQWAMMGYSIHNQFWKMGYATESVLAAREAFFQNLGFHRIELHINTDNAPSIRVAERTGFAFECTRQAFSYENESWTDMLIYYKNRNEN